MVGIADISLICFPLSITNRFIAFFNLEKVIHAEMRGQGIF